MSFGISSFGELPFAGQPYIISGFTISIDYNSGVYIQGSILNNIYAKNATLSNIQTNNNAPFQYTLNTKMDLIVPKFTIGNTQINYNSTIAWFISLQVNYNSPAFMLKLSYGSINSSVSWLSSALVTSWDTNIPISFGVVTRKDQNLPLYGNTKFVADTVVPASLKSGVKLDAIQPVSTVASIYVDQKVQNYTSAGMFRTLISPAEWAYSISFIFSQPLQMSYNGGTSAPINIYIVPDQIFVVQPDLRSFVVPTDLRTLTITK